MRFHGVRGGRSSPQVNAGSIDERSRHRRSRVAVVAVEIGVGTAADDVAEHLVAPLDLSAHRLCIRVDQELRRVEPVAFVRLRTGPSTR